MVTLFSDRVPLAMLLQIVWKRQSAVLKSWQYSGAEPTSWPTRFPQSNGIEAGPSPQSPKRADRRHDGPSLTRLRHVWYHDAVEYDARYDSHYFVRSGEWVEPKCADPHCELCKYRPRRYPGPPLPQAVPEWLVMPSDVRPAEQASG